MRLREHAPAKLNLFLHVTGTRGGGYHTLESLVVFTEAGDVLEGELATAVTLSLEGPFAGSLNAKDNLVMKAAEALRKRFGVKHGAALTLAKHLPVASGIGGGSADAAATLRLLCRLWKLDINDPRVEEIALALGADVPACMLSVPLILQGIGEIVTPVAADEKLWLVLVNSGKALPTAEVFAHHGPPFTKPLEDKNIPVLTAGKNDLQATAIALMPEIAEVLSALRAQSGCSLSRMSGSGATCFGWFENRTSAKAAEKILATAHPNWWVKATRTL